MSIIVWIPKLLVTGGVFVFNKLMSSSIINTLNPGLGENAVITPFRIFFGKYPFLGVNFFQVNAGASEVITEMRGTVATWFYVLRVISVAVLLCVLIYVGIRMAISTIAEEKARYQKMLVDWVCSLALIFVLHWIAIFTIYANDAIVKAIEGMMVGTDLDQTITEIMEQSLIGLGIDSILAFFVYVVITMQTLFFLVAYIMRMFKVGFLIIISPLISVTYSIDKMGDGKAQALNAWLKEFVYTILTQPFHCILYLAFANTAVVLLQNNGNGSVLAEIGSLFDSSYNQLINGILAILCFKFISDGEKILRKIFNFQNDDSSTSMLAGAAMGMAAINTAKKVGGATKKTASAAKKVMPGVSNDLSKFWNNSKIAQKLNSGNIRALNRVSNAAKKTSAAVRNSKAFKGANRSIAKVRTLNGRFKNFSNSRLGRLGKKSTAALMGMMGMAMMYASGQNNALKSYVAGKALYGATDQYFNRATSTEAASQAVNNQVLDDMEYKELQGIDDELKATQEALRNGDPDAAGAYDDVESAENEEREAQNNFSNADSNYAMKQAQLADAEEELQKARRNAARNNDERSKARLIKAERERNRCQEEFEKADTAREKARAELDEKTRIAQEKRDIADQYKDTDYGKVVEKRKKLQEELRNFDNPEKTLARIQAREQTPGTDLESQKNKILTLIMQLQKQRELDSQSETDQSKQYHYSSSGAKAATKDITDGIDRAVLGGSTSFDVRDLIRNVTGFESDRPGSVGYQLAKACEQYEKLSRQHEVANSYNRMYNMNIDSQRHAQNMLDTQRTRMRTTAAYRERKRQQKSQETEETSG